MDLDAKILLLWYACLNTIGFKECLGDLLDLTTPLDQSERFDRQFLG